MSAERMQLHGVAETSLIATYLRACDARAKSPVLGDPYAEGVVARVDYDFAKLGRGGSNAQVIAARARQLDVWTRDFLTAHPDGQVLNLGCGLDSRPLRLHVPTTCRWVDIDQPEVIALRRRLYDLPAEVTTLGASVTDPSWWERVDSQRATLLMAEGLLMYLTGDEVHALLQRAVAHLPSGTVVFDGVASWMVTLSRRASAMQRLGLRYSWSLEDLERCHRGLWLIDDVSVLDLLARNPSSSRLHRTTYTTLAWLPPMRNAMRLQRLDFEQQRHT